MNLTDAQRDAVRCDGNTFVVACPGSGKTRALVAKLLRCLDEVRDSARRVACITYTNAAVYEIESRLRSYGKIGDENYCDISTIHAFCLNNILRHFHWRLPDYTDEFTVLPPDSERYREIVDSVRSDYGLNASARDRFEQLNREPDGTPITTYPLTTDIALDFWERLGREQFIDFPNIIYLSYCLMVEQPSIAHAIACRFAWMLVDEFQDTLALQVEMLKLIADRGITKFFLVGDPHQSIYGFAGACPDLMDEFADHITAQRNFELLGNFRSSDPIVKHAERLCPRDPPMFPCGEAVVFTEEPQYVHAATAFEAITEHYIPVLNDLGIDYGKTAILAPWWVNLLHLGRQLREYGIPVFGPGARPYKRSHLFARLAEQICAYITQPDPKLIPRVERELFRLITEVTGSTNYNVYTYAGRTTVFRLIRAGKILCKEHEEGLVWLNAAAREFATILCEDELLPQSCCHLLIESVRDIAQDIIDRRVDIANLTTADLGMFASYERSVKLLTMHRAKGREFDAVAIVDLNDGQVPHYNRYSPITEEKTEEGRRLLYVAMTRARRVLMYITDDGNWRNPSRFLGEGELGLIQ
ncbi:MAG: ATP-dependent helicase [Chloroflexota bacterium]|nr:ATP-dependent helicase [Chloroflexota bacterium]